MKIITTEVELGRKLSDLNVLLDTNAYTGRIVANKYPIAEDYCVLTDTFVSMHKLCKEITCYKMRFGSLLKSRLDGKDRCFLSIIEYEKGVVVQLFDMPDEVSFIYGYGSPLVEFNTNKDIYFIDVVKKKSCKQVYDAEALAWCRINAPEELKHLCDVDIWEHMYEKYYDFLEGKEVTAIEDGNVITITMSGYNK